MNIDELKPGRELDALVAEKVMGWVDFTWEQYHEFHKTGGISYVKGMTGFWSDPNTGKRKGNVREFLCENCLYNHGWSPSTKIADAWEVVEKLQHLHPHISYCDTTCTWTVEWANTNSGIGAWSNESAHAICLAALRAVGVV